MIGQRPCSGGPSDRDLHRLQLGLERIGVEEENTLVRIPGDNPDDIPRLLVVEFEDEYEAFFRHDLPARVRERLEDVSPELAFTDREVVSAILAEDSPIEEVSFFVSYVFPQELTRKLYPGVGLLPEENEIGKPVFGVVVGGEVVSACSSVREDERCAEAYVWTEPGYRQRGYARQTVSAWAYDLQRRGKVPFYSHQAENTASRAVARSLGLRQFLVAVAYA
jgi:RimJ/RimL family protein N-acetyltransferase